MTIQRSSPLRQPRSLHLRDREPEGAGQTAQASITLDGEAFEYYDPSIDELSTRPGRYQILYGSSSRDNDLQSLDFEVKPAS